MLLKAIHSVWADEINKPGDVFQMKDEATAKRLIKAGHAVPVRRKISLNILTSSGSDDLATNLMDENRQSDSDKNRVTFGHDYRVPDGDGVPGNDNDQGNEDGGLLASLEHRVQAESGGFSTDANQGAFTPKQRRPSVSDNDVKDYVETQVENEAGMQLQL